ncbi:homoserine acetyltransferase [Bradyrhizobium sp. USDA 4452]
MYEQWVKGTALSGGVPIIGPGRPIDTDRYYVVMVDPLGTWGASKPSDGLGIKFPQYTYFDMVQANYRMLRDHLKIARVALAAGVSMGGTQTYVWGVMHPEYVSALMPIGGTTQSDAGDPVGNWTFQLMTAAIQSDPIWQQTKGDYYNLPKEKHPLMGMAFGWSVLGLTGYDLSYRTTQSFTAVQPEIFYWDPPNEKAGLSVINRSKLYDAVDLVWRNRVGELHNINNDLGRIQSRTLVMHIKNDLWLNFKLAEKAVENIPGADLIAEESPVAHYGVFSIINGHKNDPKFVSFMDDVASLDKAQQFVDKNFRTPGVASDIDPKKSFWKDYVTYPYPVKYANAKDAKGTTWQIGYMDEYYGTDKDPKVLVIIHGKGAFAGHYGNIMQYALRSGLHGALARQLALTLPGQFNAGWQTELNTQLHRETEIVSLLLRATSWMPDIMVFYNTLIWEAAWVPTPTAGIADRRLATTIDIAALGHAAHGAIRPAALLPVEASTDDPFVAALRRIEFESSRLIQAQIYFLKSDELKSVRDAVGAAVNDRHRLVRKLWADVLESIGIKPRADDE